MAQRSTVDLQIDNHFPPSTTKPHRVARGPPQWSPWNDAPYRCTCNGPPGPPGRDGATGLRGRTGNYMYIVRILINIYNCSY